MTTPETLNPRQRRALSALLAAPLTRERLDSVAGASNSPDLVAYLRRNLGLSIPCQRETVPDRDGFLVKRGVYYLTGPDKAIARTALRGAAQ